MSYFAKIAPLPYVSKPFQLREQMFWPLRCASINPSISLSHHKSRDRGRWITISYLQVGLVFLLPLLPLAQRICRPTTRRIPGVEVNLTINASAKDAASYQRTHEVGAVCVSVSEPEACSGPLHHLVVPAPRPTRQLRAREEESGGRREKSEVEG